MSEIHVYPAVMLVTDDGEVQVTVQRKVVDPGDTEDIWLSINDDRQGVWLNATELEQFLAAVRREVLS